MPVRNVVRVPVGDSYYHVYNRGHNKDLLFLDQEDYTWFEWLLQRTFGPVQQKSDTGKAFPWFGDQIRLNAYCLMPNHFHLLLYLGDDESALSKSMQSLAVTYSMYFNKKYQKRGKVFESVFKSSRVDSDQYLLHITRYIHLNPREYKSWSYSSYRDYLSDTREWLRADMILDLFASREEYVQFVDDYKDLKDELDSLKYILADSGDSLL